jgi:hypothetical protein
MSGESGPGKPPFGELTLSPGTENQFKNCDQIVTTLKKRMVKSHKIM